MSKGQLPSNGGRQAGEMNGEQLPSSAPIDRARIAEVRERLVKQPLARATLHNCLLALCDALLADGKAEGNTRSVSSGLEDSADAHGVAVPLSSSPSPADAALREQFEEAMADLILEVETGASGYERGYGRNQRAIEKAQSALRAAFTSALQSLRKDSERLDAIPALMFLDEGDGRDFGPVQINRDADGVTRFYAYLDGRWLPMDTLRAAIDAAALTTRAGAAQ